MVLLRREVGNALRSRRRDLGRTLREVSAQSSVSLGYLSEIERGEKEASSELLASICQALQMPMSQLLVDVSDRVALEEAKAAVVVPMTTAKSRGRVGATAA
ncbi:MAG: helix-turn-helix transcriptional regulator [Dermatophilus congolensis]|nr:helix-turn-helix transcriptional regulator [Dermatophilus congolensis]